jgi:hypothetical protein
MAFRSSVIVDASEPGRRYLPRRDASTMDGSDSCLRSDDRAGLPASPSCKRLRFPGDPAPVDETP